MGTSPPNRSSSPLRAVGLVLLGLAVMFGALGVLTPGEAGQPAAVSSAPGGAAPSTTSAEPTAQPTTTTAAPRSPTTTPAPAQTPAQPTPVQPATTAQPTPVQPATTAQPQVPAGEQPVSTDPRDSVAVVILNNSTVSGLAAQAADDVGAQGWTVAEVGNFTGLVPTTTVYYGDGERAAAQALAADVGARVEPRSGGLPRTAAGVVLVVTGDYAGG